MDVSAIKSALASLPRSDLARVGRELLQLLGNAVESSTSNVIAHEGEVFVIGELDSLLAKIEQSSAPTPAP